MSALSYILVQVALSLSFSCANCENRGKAMTDKEPSKKLSINEVCQLTSSIETPSISAPIQSTIQLTPTSSEACLRHGVVPEILQNREFHSFFENGVDCEIQQLRCDAYAQRRQELMKLVIEEREKIRKRIAEKSKIDTTDPISLIISPCKTNTGSLQLDEANSLFLKEQQLLEKIKIRQKKDLMQVLQFESKMEQLQREARERLEREALEAAQRSKEREIRAKKAAEIKRQQDLRRKAEEEAAEELRRQLAQEMIERTNKLLREREREEKEIQRHALLAEQERKEKLEMQRINRERKAELERMEMEQRMQERAQKELENKEKMEKKRQQNLEDFANHRRQVAARIARNQKVAKSLEEKKKAEITEKMQNHEMLRKQKEQELEERLEAKRKEKELMDRKRALHFQATKDAEKARKDELLSKHEADDIYIGQLNDARQRELEIEKQKKAIQKLMKKDNAERIKRQQEYERELALIKMDEEGRRTEELLKKREELIQQRQRAAREAKIQKDKLIMLLEKTKMSGSSSAINKLTKLVEETVVPRRASLGYSKVHSRNGTMVREGLSPKNSPMLNPNKKASGYAEDTLNEGGTSGLRTKVPVSRRRKSEGDKIKVKRITKSPYIC